MKFFTQDEENQIVKAIQEAEEKTSGEIRVHLLRKIKKSIYEDAVVVFEKLGMTKTELRNGILFVIAPEQHQFTVIGDLGIHEKVGAEFWIQVRDSMQDQFKKGSLHTGLIDGILTCGHELARHFPRSSEDKNELPDDLSKDHEIFIP